MKIVHLQSVVTPSGNAPYRLHKFLLENGIDSKMIVQQKKLNDETVSLYKNNNLEKFLWSNMRIYLEKFFVERILKVKNITTFSSWKIGVCLSNHPWIKEADIVHMHWINGGFISLNEIEKILKLKKQVIWTFHDNAPFTGGCHVRGGCEKYQENCKDCPLIENRYFKRYPERIMQRKNNLFKNFDNLKIITPSRWMMKNAEKSRLFKFKEKIVIPNVLDSKIFKELDKKTCRKILSLEDDKKYLLFGAVSIKDPNKGYKELKQALDFFKNKNKYDDLEILIFGRIKLNEELPFKIRDLGEINNEILLAIVYNAADLFIGPSHEESFGQVFNESIFCGTPAIAFDGSGSSDIIRHLKNGFLAKPYIAEELVEGIEFFLNNKIKVESREEVKSKKILEKIREIYQRNMNI